MKPFFATFKLPLWVVYIELPAYSPTLGNSLFPDFFLLGHSLRSWRDFFGGCVSGGDARSLLGFRLDSSPFFSRRVAFFPPLAFETLALTRENSANFTGYLGYRQLFFPLPHRGQHIPSSPVTQSSQASIGIPKPMSQCR